MANNNQNPKLKAPNKSGFMYKQEGIDRDEPSVKKQEGKDLRTRRSKGGK